MGLAQQASRTRKEFLQYVKSHIWVSLIGTMLAIFLLAALIFQNYLKNQYLNYLIDETWQTENALLSAAAVNLNVQLNSALSASSEIAVNQDLRYIVEYALDSSADQRVRSLMTLSSKLSEMSYYSSDIVNIAIFTQDGLLQEYGRNWAVTYHPGLWADEEESAVDRIYSDVYARMFDDMIGRYVVTTAPAFHQDFPDMQMFHIALPLLGKASSFQNVNAVVVVSFQLSGLVRSGALAGSRQNYVCGYLTDRDATIIYHERKELIGTDENEYLSQGGSVFLVQPLSCFDWDAHIAIDTASLHDNVNRMYNQGVVIYILMLIVCGAVWNLLMHHILCPIGIIGSAMNEIRSGKPNHKIQVQGTHEIWQLAEQYNDMLDSLHEQQQEVQRQFDEKTRFIQQKNQAEREALESQINAHFLCNTLNAINYNVLGSGNTEVAALLKRLSSILYYTFSRSTQDVTLGQELDWVQQYLYLQKYRLGDRFSYQIDFPEEYREWPCCKLVLQPFVENSILHGFENMESGGMIRITGRPEQDRFRIEIRDNGCGMSPRVERAIQQSILLDVAEYILKPITRADVVNALARVERRIQGKRSYSVPKAVELREKYPDAHPLILRALDMIQARYAGKINQRELAEELGISPEYFSYLFSKNVREPFSAFLRRYRIERAKELYRTGSCDKREAPYAVGFSDAKYFNQVFRKITGMSPSEYLSEYRN